MKTIGYLKWIGVLAALSLISGCAKPAGAPAAPPVSTASDKKSEAKAEAPPAEPAEKGLDVSTVPAALKSEGYQYYGLDEGSPVEFEISQAQGTAPMTGTSSTRLVAVEKGIARFASAKTGILSRQGDEELEARPDGIYNTKVGKESVKPAQLVMPAQVPPGKVWETVTKVLS